MTLIMLFELQQECSNFPPAIIFETEQQQTDSPNSPKTHKDQQVHYVRENIKANIIS